ncbi:reverse transcriptase domain-containing protein [Tanacetum coccineum]
MAERIMEELLRAPTEGYGEAIVLPEINADHFEIKTNLLQLVQANPFNGCENENPHAHINSFKRITSTLRFWNVPNDVIKLMMFPYSLEGAAKTCEAWERFKELLRACPHHRFTELTQVDTFYNGLNENEQDSLNAAVGGNLLSKTTREALNIIKNKSKVRYSCNRSNASRMNVTSSKTDERIDKLADQLSTLVEIVSKKVVTPAPVKAVEESCVTCGGAHAWDPRFLLITRSGVAYEGPSIPTNPSPKKVVERETEDTTDKKQTNFQGTTAHIPPPVNPILIPEPDVPKTLPKPNILYPSRRNDQKSRDKASNQMEKIFQIFQDLRFDISFADALLLMPRFAPTIRNLLMNKEKWLELAKITLNENCSAMLLKMLPEKLGDPGKFLILCNFPGMDVCHALADLGASINLMPLSIWKKLSLPELTPTQMTLELADRSITHPKGVTEDVFVKVGSFHFPIDFVVVDFEADPRVPLILGRSFLTTSRALIDVYGEEITLRVDNEAITFNLDQTTRYSSTNDKSVNRIDIIDEVWIVLKGDEHLSTFSAEEIIPIPRESEDTSRSDSKNILPSYNDFLSINGPCDDSVIFSIPLFGFNNEYVFSDVNPLFDEMLEDIECKDSYDSNFDKTTFLVTPLSNSNKDKCLTLGEDIEFLLHHDPSTPMKSVASILEGFIDERPFEENDDLFDLECKTNDWKIILYDAPIDEAECFDPGGDNNEIDAFLAMEVSTNIEEGYYDSKGDVIFLENLLSDDTTHNLSPEVFFNHEPQHDTFSPKSDPLHHEFTGIESDFDSEEDIIDNLLNDDPIPEYERLNSDMNPDVTVIKNIDVLNEMNVLTRGREINVELIDPEFSEDSRVRCFVPVHSSFLAFACH